MEIRRRHWILALCGAASIHAALAAAILWHPLDAGAESVDFGGVEVALVSAGEAAGDETQSIAAEDEVEPVDAETTAPIEPPPKDVEVVEEPTEVETVDAPAFVETVEPTEIADEAAELVVEAEPVPQEAQTIKALPLEPTETAAINAADAVPVEAPLEEAQAVEPELVKAESVLPTPPVRPQDLPKVARAAPPRQATPRPRASQPAASEPSRQAVSGAGARADASAIRRYSAELAAALRARLRYPDAARARRIEGVATVRFSIDASGRVIGSSLAASAGDARLDQAALATVRPGTSLPAPPPPHDGSVTVSVPLRFSIR